MEEIKYILWRGIFVTKADAAALDNDLLLYGRAYVETNNNEGCGKRIDPTRLVLHVKEDHL